MDKVSVQQRSRNMSAVRSINTKPEKVVRRVLHSLGLRFRLHDVTLPGTPDVVLKKHRAVVFVHGCFWHGHHCRRGRLPSTNREFWREKRNGNKRRDRRQLTLLRKLGWRTLVIWECETVDKEKLRLQLEHWFTST